MQSLIDHQEEQKQQPKRAYSRPELSDLGEIRNVTLGVPSQTGESGETPQHPIVGP
jgi:hypothetical protein